MEREFVSSLKRHLRLKGYAVTGVHASKEAEQFIRRAGKEGHPFDLVITHAHAARPFFTDFLQWIVTCHPDISLLVVADFGLGDLIERTIRPDLDDYDTKPLTPQRMMTLIDSLDRRRFDRRAGM